MIDFFVNHCQLQNGFSHGIFDPIHDRFTHWFTGILMPFQYAADENDVRRFVGRQIADGAHARSLASSAVGGQLPPHDVRVDVSDPARLPATTARARSSALARGRSDGSARSCSATQAEDGSWFRAYDPDGDRA